MELSLACLVSRVKDGEEVSTFVDHMPPEVGKMLRGLVKLQSDSFAYWVSKVNTISLVPHVDPSFLTRAIVESLKRGEKILADALLNRLITWMRSDEYKKDRCDPDRYDKIIRLLGRTLDAERARKYHKLLPRRRDRKFIREYATGVVRGGHEGVFRNMLERFTVHKLHHWDDLMIAAIASGRWSLFELILKVKEYPESRVSEPWVLEKAVRSGNVKVVQWFFKEVTADFALSKYPVYIATGRERLEVIDALLSFPRQHPSLVSKSCDWEFWPLWILRSALLISHENILSHLWNNKDVDRALKIHGLSDRPWYNESLIEVLVQQWTEGVHTQWLVRTLALYHDLPIPISRDSEEEDAWIASHLAPHKRHHFTTLTQNSIPTNSTNPECFGPPHLL